MDCNCPTWLPGSRHTCPASQAAFKVGPSLMGHGVAGHRATLAAWGRGQGQHSSSAVGLLSAPVRLQTQAGPRCPSGGLGPTQDVEAPGAEIQPKPRPEAALLRNHTQSRTRALYSHGCSHRPGHSSRVGADGGQLQLVPGLRGVSWLLVLGFHGVSWLFLARVTETQLDATPSAQPCPCPPTATLERTGPRPGAWG